ncbi:methyltransferase domain-containing protein [Alphaproteobacteria bacterium GH1-50]|uniref:Ribosomal protein L11 methyltransferase n=1 Tax=Kangsaoukella pontilimi TaxID=2691042 RepID=A0A7C9ITB9_9RHOB|nr:50S ribosomal protein L11 methyltransferase [Kangsaoukella pontilimi]MXQ08705.1 methyltransferase domain-containing protein [Kangsaoukella pontilimi]
MTTWTALTTVSGKAQAEALGEALEQVVPEPVGVGVFEIEDGRDLWEVGGYFTEAPDAVSLALLAAAWSAGEFVVSEVPETDWVAHVRRELSPVEAGRFFVYGAHDADKVPEGRIALRIEAAMAFGTGHHGTTLGCLRALDRLVTEGLVADRVADIGCGTAVLAMAAASVWPGQVVASDIDAVAVDVARANLEANGLETRVTCVEAAGFGHPMLDGEARFDLVFANILKGPLLMLAEDMARAVSPGGHAILSGLLTDQAEEILEHYRRAGFNTVHREDIVDWTTLTLSRIR